MNEPRTCPECGDPLLPIYNGESGEASEYYCQNCEEQGNYEYDDFMDDTVYLPYIDMDW